MRKLALTIGINYRGGDAPLQGCSNDAQDWAKTLDQHGFEVAGLTEAEATRAAIIGQIGGMLETADADSIATVTFSGHGTRVPDRDGDEVDGWDEAIVPHDYRAAGMILDDDLYQLFAPAEQRGVRVVWIADSCFSGTVNRLAPALAPTFHRAARWLPPGAWMPPRRLERLASTWASPKGTARRSALTMTGASDMEVAYDAFIDGRARGAFTAAALAALETGPPTYRAWHAAIRRLLPSTDYPQSPQLNASPGQRRWAIFEPFGVR